MATTSLRIHRRRTGERAIKGALLACGVVSVATTIGIVLSLAFETFEFFRRVPILDYLTGTEWAPTSRPPNFGVLPLISATLLIAGIAIVVAVPLGLGSAIFLSEYAKPRARKIIKPILEVLAGIPTVVLGYFALNFVTKSLLKSFIPGLGVFNALSAGLVVGIMIVPLIASISEDAMRAVPASLREAAYGIGAKKRIVATKVVVPAALSGIAAAVILGLSRAIGETMIVTVAAGLNPNLSANPQESMATMTAYIVQVSLGDTPQTGIAYKTIFAVGSTLFLMTLALNIASARIVRRFQERYE
jgi:phosphate transport system permease protein